MYVVIGQSKVYMCSLYIMYTLIGDSKGQVTFTLTASLKRSHKIFNVPQIKQTVEANGVRQYGFCITDERRFDY